MFEAGRTLYLARFDTGNETVPMQIVLNFLAARTQVLRDNPWDNELKMGEHEDFFWRARQAGVQVGYCPQAVALHMKDPTPSHYTEHRNRSGIYQAKAREKHGWEKVVWVQV